MHGVPEALGTQARLLTSSLLCQVSHTHGPGAGVSLAGGEAGGADRQEPEGPPPTPRHRLCETLEVLLLSSWK